MKKGLIRALSVLLTFCSLASSGGVNANATESSSGYIDNCCSAASYTSAPTASVSTSDTESLCAFSPFTDNGGDENIKVGSRFWELFFGKDEPKQLIASGDIFGVKMKQKFPTVVEAPGIPTLKCGDCIISVNHKSVSSAKEVKDTINSSEGASVTIVAMRGAERITLELVPKLEGGEYRLGVTLKDITAGIGTITFIDPKTGAFGGLGHGICDAENGSLIEMSMGNAMEVLLGGIHKGEIGCPGELSGIMTDKPIGEISKNTEVGVFGKLDQSNLSQYGSVYEVASKDEIKPGEATIISTLKNGKKAEYKIEIYDIDKSSSGSKSFKIKVKDPALTAITGGIVRGMSGSPIIQNGKLIGAVTHVLVADPTSGYGIFIENMLNVTDNVNNNSQKAA